MRNSIRSLLVGSWLGVFAATAWSAQFVTDFNSGAPAGSTPTGTAIVDTSGGIGNSGVLKLTINAGGQSGGYVIDDFNGGTPVTSFKAVARVAIGGGTSRPADGMSLSFGTDVSSGAGGEEGEGTGLVVAIDTWDNAAPDTAPAFELKYGGAVLAFQSMAGIREGGRAPDGPILTDGGGNPVAIETHGPAPAAPPNGSFVNLVVELFADNTVSVSWSNVVVFNHLPVPYTPLSGAKFAFGARTGGATDNHWVDNLAIFVNHTPAPVTLITGPADQTATEGQSATFTTEVAGTPPYQVRWFRNGVLIPGATELFYTTPPTVQADNGALYRAEISNAESSLVTREALLTVVGATFVRSVKVDACDNHTIVVQYNKTVVLFDAANYNLTGGAGQVVNGWIYGADHSQVRVDTEPLTADTPFTLEISGVRGEDGSSLAPDPTSVPVSFGFGRFCADFEDGLLPPGTVSTGSTPPAVGPGAGGLGQVLHITDRVNSQQNHWTVELPSTLILDRFQARWNTYLEGLGGADGFSFNVGFDADAPPFSYAGGVEEEGATSGLSVTVDTFDNGGGETGAEIRWNGARLVLQSIGVGNGPPELMKAQFVPASVDLTPSGFVTFKYDIYTLTAQIPGWTGNFMVNRYEFGARTGGANENFWIDDLCINAFTPSAPLNLTGPVDQTAIAGATATFNVSVGDGLPPFTYQWLRGGAPIAGATGASYSFTAAAADQGAEFSVIVRNDCGTATSQVARLDVIVAPVLLSCSSRGNCHAIYLTYSKPVLLDGTYSVVCSNTIPAVGVQFFAEDFNAGDGGFTVQTPFPYDGPWIYDAGSGSWTQAGQGPGNQHGNNTSLLISPALNVTQAGVVSLTFAHRHSFEGGRWDGGQVRISVNNGPLTVVPGSAFTQNGYNGVVLPGSSSDIRGEAAFIENSVNFAGGPSSTISTCTLGTFQAGDSIQVVFIAAADENTTGQFQPNWQIDSLQLAVADPAVSPITITGVTYGEGSNVVCLAVSPDLIADTRIYAVTAQDVHDTDGVAIFPNPTRCSLIHGSEYPIYRVLVKRFDNIGGGISVPDLVNNPKFPNAPDQVLRDPTGFFEIPVDAADNYGAQVLGWAVAPVEGDYRFWVSSDDRSELYISVDSNPAHKVLIAREPEWNGSRQYAACDRRTCDGNGRPVETQSAPIHLLAGQVVYLEGLVKEGGGGDNFSVAATVDDPNAPANGSSPISAQFFQPRRLGPGGVTFSRLCDVFCNPGPSDQTVYLGQSATFTFTPDGTPPYSIQWKKNGTVISGASGTSYTTPAAVDADDGAVFTACLNNAFSSTNCSAVLHLRPNPIVLRCYANCDNHTIRVLYNRPVRSDVGNYEVNANSIVVNGVSYGASQSEVVLDVEPFALESDVTLVISDVPALGGAVLEPNPTTCTFHYGFNRFCVDFNDGQLPPGTVSSGTTPPYVGPDAAGITPGVFMHITDQVNGQANYWTIPLAGTQNFPIFSARWKLLVEGPGGADGVSFNVGVNPAIPTPEDGGNNGLSVAVDTFNNGAGDAGLDIAYNGTRLAHLPVGAGADGSGAPPELATGQFLDTSVDVTSSGFVTFKYGTYSITAQIPNYAGINANQYVFAARTGGANEKAWVDDLCINPWTPGVPVVTTQPANATVGPECVGTATFNAVVDGTPPYDVQWYSNDVVVASVTGSVGQSYSYTTPALNRTADGARYKAVIRNTCGEAASADAVISVISDTNPPVLLAAYSPGGCIQPAYTKVILRFDEALDAASAGTLANYSVNDGAVTVTSARLISGGGLGQTAAGAVPANGTIVELMLASPLRFVDCHVVTVRGVLDFCTFNAGGGSAPIELRTPLTASGPQNLIVIEAENWDFNRSPGTTNVGGAQGALDQNSWARSTALPGFLGAGYVEAIPNITSFGGNFPTEPAFYASPRLDYCVNVPVDGTYYIWARGSSANDGGNNSFHMAVDGVSVDDRARRIGNRIANWGGDAGNVNAFGWINDAQVAPAAIDLTAGVHTINVLMREDGMRLDRILLTTDATFTLATADVGPDASVRETVPGDTTPPSITCPSNILVGNALGLCGAIVTWPRPIVIDDCPGSNTVSCTPMRGSVFPVGSTVVTCTGRDAAGNAADCTFNVTVRDTEAPRITCPADITVSFTGATGAVVTWSLSVTDNCAVATRACTPMRGSLFPIGNTTVNCSATDTSSNSASCSFTVTVLGAQSTKRECLDALVAFRDTVTDKDDGKKLDDAIYRVRKSLNPDYWVDDLHLTVKKGNKVFHDEREAVKKLEYLKKSKKSNIPDATLQAFIDCFKKVDRLLAVVAINEAAAAGVKPKKIEKALEELAKGDRESAEADCDKAIEHYGHAWEQTGRIRVETMPAPGGGLRLVFYPFDDIQHDVEASSDLVNWTKIGSVRANAEGLATYDIPNTGPLLLRFYRVREE